ncbi:MAG: dihydrolipoyl dehydrogenase [Clostridiales bacterium]|nr:dihydrolipoyl dehydrogenase [Clostridiales bacterium]
MYDLIVIGGGPAGYLASERAAHAGMKVCLFEKNAIGGVCLNEGCIPSKALLNSAKIYEHARDGRKYGVLAENVLIDQKAVVLRRGKVVRTLVAGVSSTLKRLGVAVVKEAAVVRGRVEGGFAVTAGRQDYEAKRLLIAAGSVAVVPPIPGVRENLGGFVLTNREVLELPEIPKDFVIVGGGVIGLEMAAYYAVAGSRVTVVEMLDHIAGPTDREISTMLRKEYAKRGVDFRLSAKVVAVEPGKVVCEADGKTFEIPADKVLLSIGRRAATEGIGLENIGIATERGVVLTDEQCRTNVENVYAAGDCIGKVMLAHTAYREAEVAVNTMLGKKDRMRYNANPSVIYTHPEVATVGMTEEEAVAAGVDFEVKKLSMRFSGRFIAENEGADGLCKMLIHKKHRNILGVHMIGNASSEVVWGAALMIEQELRVKDAKEIIFPHPTVSEIIRETIWEFDD